MSKYNPAKVNEAVGVFVLERNKMPSAEKMLRAGEIIAAELARVNTARDENAVALAAAVRRADAAEQREKVMREALNELIDSRGGSGKRINSAWQKARYAVRCTGTGILRAVEKPDPTACCLAGKKTDWCVKNCGACRQKGKAAS